MAESRYCAACGRNVAMGVHYCPAEAPRQGLSISKDAEIAALKARVAEMEKELERVKDVCKQLNRDKNDTFYQSCENLKRAEKAEAHVTGFEGEQADAEAARDRLLMGTAMLMVDMHTLECGTNVARKHKDAMLQAGRFLRDRLEK